MIKKKRGTKLKMTPLDWGLACTQRKEGRAIADIARALNRCPNTLAKRFAKHNIKPERKNHG